MHGGHVVVAGDLDELLTAKTNKSGSVTLDYLRGDDKIDVPTKRRDSGQGKAQIRGGNIFNIKDMNIDVPLGKLVAISGVSGSGKSSFMYEIIASKSPGSI